MKREDYDVALGLGALLVLVGIALLVIERWYL